jgi:hypothetical protein
MEAECSGARTILEERQVAIYLAAIAIGMLAGCVPAI